MIKILENVYLIFGYGHNCNGYLVRYSDEESLLIDTGLGIYDRNWGFSNEKPYAELLSLIKEFNVKNIILTHYHLDHLGGAMSLPDDIKKNITFICHENEQQYIEEPNYTYIDPFMKTVVKALKIDQAVSQNDQLNFGSFNLDIIHTPGHTPGSFCLYDKSKKVLFSGDCVFPEGSFGRVDFPGSDADQMISSLEYLTSLDINSLLAGHMEPIQSNANESIKLSFNNAKYMLF